MNARTKAQNLLIHYFDLAGVVADNDNRAEVRQIVDEIINAIEEEMLSGIVRREDLVEEAFVDGLGGGM